MTPLPIVWQRLVSASGTTCPRCKGTEEGVQRALASLTAALAPLGVKPTLETVELNEAAFQAQPSESNRIWIAGRPMEEWIEGKVGRSPCSKECGPSECRTVEVAGSTFEVIPEQLLVRAGLIAAAHLLSA